MRHERPLLTIAIPTYNRSALLNQLLAVLIPQIDERNRVELLISDNASPDDTKDIVRYFQGKNACISYHCHADNVGSDANFITCFELARGKYFWLLGDDDIVLPGGLEKILNHLEQDELDLVYLTSYGFQRDWEEERKQDPLGREYHTIESALQFVLITNVMLTFISGIIINRDRFLEVPHESIQLFAGTNLIQLSWSLPLLRNHRRSLVLWKRVIAARQGNAAGYHIGKVFGERLRTVSTRCLPDRPRLVDCICNFAVRRWFPPMILELRGSARQELGLEEAEIDLRRSAGRNFRFWLFVYPVLKLPLPAARLWCQAGVFLSKMVYVVSVRSFWRKRV